ncbi:DUF624 domain-containing protein [Alteribacter salitolerans]|uniref:DUF624 domain-containing protein n=1 Tax=Alteribacter salitolerans TaxID=2912333 RepID=UPI003AF960A0
MMGLIIEKETISMSIIGHSFKQYFYHLFKVLAAGTIWLLLSIPILTAGPATAGYSYFIYQIQSREDSKIRHLFTGVKQYFRKSIILGTVITVPPVVLLSNFIFFFQQSGFLFYFYAMLCFYCFLAWVLVSQYAFSVLVQKEEIAIKEILKYCFLYLKRGFWKSIFLLFPITLLTLISLPTLVFFIFVMLPLHFLTIHNYLSQQK